MLVFYCVCSLILLVILFWMLFSDVKKSMSQNIMILFMAMSGVGYIFLSLSENLNEAVLANKIIYLNGCFLPMLFFFTVCELCHINLFKTVKCLLVILQSLIYVFICTIGLNKLYYKSIVFKIENGEGMLIKEYGPLHTLYIIIMYTYLVMAIFLTIYTIKLKNNVNDKELICIIVSATVAVIIYTAPKFVGIDYDISLVGNIILMLGSLIPIYHSNLYTANENRNIVMEQMNRVGYITFNKKMEYMGSNDYAKDIFPELYDCVIGYNIKSDNGALQNVISEVKDYSRQIDKKRKEKQGHDKFITLKIDEHYYETEIYTIVNFVGKCMGYTIELIDETEHNKIIELTTKYNENLEREVEEKTRRIRQIQRKTILGIAQMVESRDLSTGGHVKRTSDVVGIFSEKLKTCGMGFDRKFLDNITRSAPMHDLGKIGVDDSILRKNGSLSDGEYEEIKKHAEIGGKMVLKILKGVEEDDFVKVAYNVAQYHHEKVDGTGYPEGLKQDEIPVEARIMALADVFDTLVSKRCYKEPLSYDKAFAIIEKDAGTHFDKELAKVFLSCRDELEEYYDSCNS